jgi:tetratricopeptide (TPR) repeat protein
LGQHPLEIALAAAEARLAQAPDSPEQLFERAALLDALGRPETRDAYLAVLNRAPTHAGALANLGALLFRTGYRSAARTVYAHAIAHRPEDAAAHVNLANLLSTDEPELARRHFETALSLAPGLAEAHRGLAKLFNALGEDALAEPHRVAGFGADPIEVLPYRGTGRPVRLLALASTRGGGVPLAHHLDDQVFETAIVYVEAFDPARPLPACDLIFNTLGDADQCGEASLAQAARVLAGAAAPVINPPERIVPTGRADNARTLGALPGVVTPRMAVVARGRLLGPDAAEHLAGLGFVFPLLLRAPGFHTGQHFERIEGPEDLGPAAAAMPGEALIVMQFLDARSADGKIRKYRAMIVDGRLYPLHAAVSRHWKIHYFSAEMADSPEHRAEDEAFLSDMAAALGPNAMTALEAVRETLGLDYGGIDFSLTPQGEVILFEANATMVVHRPDPDPRWDYRRPYVQAVLDAVQRLLRKGPTNRAA